MQDIFLILAIILFFAIIIAFFFNKKIEVDKSQNANIRDLERRLTDLMASQLREIRDGTSRDMQGQIHSFAKETTEIKEGLKQIQEKVKDVSSFQDIFKSPKLRGQWGEASLEYILNQHFPAELYKKQYLFPSGQQVDAALKLPNGRILPIDAKFPLENFAKMVEADSEEKKVFCRKNFIEDIKFKINDISAKYIQPSEDTVDFALMYIPAEAIYYEIINNISKETDIAEFAWKKRVVLTSPNTIYLTLRTVEHWFRDTQISKQTYDILKRLSRVRQDAAKLSDDFRKLGGHLQKASSSYDNSQKRLSLLDERVEKLTDIKEMKKLKES